MPTVETQLSPGVHAGHQARNFVHDILHTSGLDHVDHAVELLTTELVNNVVVHAPGAPTLRITPDSQMVRVEVDDRSTDAPVLEVPDERAESGRGLLLVATIADDWGFGVGSHGKTVWFEIRTQRAAGS
jgi:anti-sigma regulatory factor (Ser/Thr protein kinase)